MLRVVFILLFAATVAHAARSKISAEEQAETEVEDNAGVQSSGMQEGEMFNGRYRLISLLKTHDWPKRGLKGYKKVSYLGKGAFGETWLAYDAKRGENVAVKFFYTQTRQGVQLLNFNGANYAQKQALKEAGTECDVPKNIINGKAFPEGQARFARCFHNGVYDAEYAHLVLEVAGTENLEEYMARKGKNIDSTTIKRLAKMMLEGLVQMEGKYVHKDIKPANLMVYTDAEDGQLYLRYIDFGLVAENNKKSGVAGTPIFMPPEVWPVVPYNPTIGSSFDIYSAGETLYNLICGKTFHEYVFDNWGEPFRESTVASKLNTVSPTRFCSPRSSLTSLFSLVVDNMMVANAGGRARASALLGESVFHGISTMKEVAQPKPNKPKPAAQKPVAQKPVAQKPIDMVAVEVKAPKNTFLDDCHADKGFWFAHAKECCLKEKFDAKRDAICRRPCGPNVPYQNGQCANNCNTGSKNDMKFNKKLHCCVANVWETKCIYKDFPPAGEGWGWQ